MLMGQHFYWQLSSPLSSPLSTFETSGCERLTMDLFVQQDSQLLTLTELGFAPSHPRYWAALPSDVELYCADTLSDFWAEAAHPRFPLAGEDSPKLLELVINQQPQFPQAQDFYLPLGIQALPENRFGRTHGFFS